jgi:hypothetical protein
MTGCMYPPVGEHNGHTQAVQAGSEGYLSDLPTVLAGSEEYFDMPEEGRTILVFMGSTDKIGRASVFAWCEMLLGTGHGPESAILMLLDGPETNVRAVDRWRREFNEQRSSSETCGDVIPPSRIHWFPYRQKELFWLFIGAARHRMVSVSCREYYDVHTLAGDSLSRGVLHLCMDTPSQDWPQRVAQLLVKFTGLYSILVANSEADFIRKGISLLLDAALRRAASDHLLDCKARQVGYYARDQRVTSLTTMLLGALSGARRAGGDVRQMKDMDFTKGEPSLVDVQFNVQPGLIPFGETAQDQLQRFMQQLKVMSRTVGDKLQPFESLFKTIICAIHKQGYRGMHILGLGSSCVCARATYSGEGDPERSGRSDALKITHFGYRYGQENRLHADAIVISLNVWQCAGLRRLGRAARLLPQPFRVWPGDAYAGVVAGGKYPLPSEKGSPARSRLVMTFAAFKYIEEGAMANDPRYKKIVDEYTKSGVISDTRTRIIQAIFFSVFFLNERGIFNMDISLQNLALQQDEHRWLVVWIDTGGSLVMPVQSSAPMCRMSTSLALPAGEAPGHKIPALMHAKDGVSYINMKFVQDCAAYASSNRALTCFGTDTFRDEVALRQMQIAWREEEKQRKGRSKTFSRDQASRWDSFAAACVVVQSFRPAPKASADLQTWKEELLAAREASSSERMKRFLEGGMVRGTSVERPEVLEAYAQLLHSMLRTDETLRIGVQQALLKRLLTTDTWTPDQKAALDGDGIPFEGQWPTGSQWAHKPVPRLSVVDEPGMGAGVRTDQEIEKGLLVTLYVGTEATEIGVDEYPPCRRTTYATGGCPKRARDPPVGQQRILHAGNERIHTVSDQPFQMLLEMNAAGPLLNASLSDAAANVQLDRGDYWRDGKGNVYIGMYAKDRIAAGTFLHWNYDYRAGRGGINSYCFPDD